MSFDLFLPSPVFFFYSWQLWMYRSEVLTAESLCDSAASKQRLSAEEGGRYRRHHPPVAYNTIYIVIHPSGQDSTRVLSTTPRTTVYYTQ